MQLNISKIKTLSIFLLCLICTFGGCRKEVTEISDQKSFHAIGSPGNAVAYKMISLKNGGFALTGYVTNKKGKEIFLSKFTEEGQLLWTKTYGEDNDEEGRSIQELDDGGFLIGGYSTSYYNETLTAYVIRINKDGELQWKNTYPHKTTNGLPIIYHNLMADHIHMCADGTFNLMIYNGSFRTVGGIYSLVRGQRYNYIEKINDQGISLGDSLYDFKIPGHSAARHSSLFVYPESKTETLKTIEIALETGNFTKPKYYFWDGSINATNFNYTRADSITTIADSPFYLGNRVWSYLFGLNTALSPSGKKIISFVEAEKSYLILEDAGQLTIKNYPGYIQAMDVNKNGEIILAGVSMPDGENIMYLLNPEGNIIWKRNFKNKTIFCGSDKFGTIAYWGTPCTVTFGKNGNIMAAFTVDSPGGGKTDIEVVYLNQNGEIIQ